MSRQSLQVVCLCLLAPWSLLAQANEYKPSESLAPTPFGTADQPGLRYSGESPKNILSASIDTDSAYDDNVLNANNSVEDETFSVGPHVTFTQKRERLTLSLDYQPYFIFYQRLSQFDTLNHSLAFDANYQATRHLALRFREFFSYENYPAGIFEPRSSSEIVPGLGPPTSLNQTVVTPLTHTRENGTRFDLVYQKSSRSAFTLFGAALDQHFTRPATESVNLYSLKGTRGGLQYSYALSPTSTFGAVYVFENSTFSTQSRMVVQSGLFSYARQVSPTMTFSVFAGPQFARVHDTLTYEIPFLGFNLRVTQPIVRARRSPAFGAAFIKQTANTAFSVSGQRMTSAGGGLLREATNWSVGLSVRRRLTGRWNAVGTAEYADTSAMSFGLYESKVLYRRAGFGLERTLTERLTARLAYNFLRQRGAGQIPLLADLDRNRVSLGLFCQIGSIPLGR